FRRRRARSRIRSRCRVTRRIPDRRTRLVLDHGLERPRAGGGILSAQIVAAEVYLATDVPRYRGRDLGRGRTAVPCPRDERAAQDTARMTLDPRARSVAVVTPMREVARAAAAAPRPLLAQDARP